PVRQFPVPPPWSPTSQMWRAAHLVRKVLIANPHSVSRACVRWLALVRHQSARQQEGRPLDRFGSTRFRFQSRLDAQGMPQRWSAFSTSLLLTPSDANQYLVFLAL